jgi:hypothetical protein
MDPIPPPPTLEEALRQRQEDINIPLPPESSPMDPIPPPPTLEEALRQRQEDINIPPPPEVPESGAQVAT